jgi:hypothetical protein
MRARLVCGTFFLRVRCEYESRGFVWRAAKTEGAVSETHSPLDVLLLA